MKLYNKILSLLICSVVLLSSCDDWDFDSDSNYDGLFRTPKIEAKELEATFIDLLWNKVPNADYYKIELSEDSLKFETNLKEVGANEIISKNEYTISDLLGSTRYSVRIKAFSNIGIKESEWATYTFKTKSEQILNEVSELTSNSATLTWDPALAVDSYILFEGGGSTGGVKKDLTAAEKSEGKLVLTSLKEATTYRIVVTLGTVVRGARTFTTTENFPEGYTIVTLTKDDNIGNVLSSQSGNIVLVLPLEGDFVLGESDNKTIPNTITSVIFWGATGGEKPKFSPKGLVAVEGSALDLIKFYNLELYNASAAADYIINQNKTTTINAIIIENCTVRDTRGVVRIQSSGNASKINKIEITNTILTSIGDYNLVNATLATLQIDQISVTKSTINGQNGRTFDLNNLSNTKVYVNQCTFNNAVSNEFIRFKKDVGSDLIITNTIFGKMYTGATKVKASNPAGYVSATDVYYTTDYIWDGSNSMGTAYGKTTEDLFEDSANGNFRIKDPAFTINAGDPRWLE